MMKHYFFDSPDFRSDAAPLILGACLITGSLLGIWFSAGAPAHSLSLMRMAVGSHVSVIGSFSAAALPFLFSAFAVYLGCPVLLIPIAFLKAFFFSYAGFGLMTAWGSAGWLVAGLMLSGSAASMPVLCWYWLRCFRCGSFELPVFFLALGALLLIGMIDYCLIVPFLAGIITF